MPRKLAVYPINVAARLTGVSIDTLRAWERRHRAISPSRDHRGRMYTDSDLERLRRLRDAVATGHPIGRIAHLDEAGLRALTAAAAQPVVAQAAEHRPSAVEGIVDALERFDLATLETVIGQAAALLRPSVLLKELLVPALRAADAARRTGRLGIAHERLLSSLVRDVLGSLLRLHARRDVAGRMIFATPVGERYELDALGAALVAAASGLGAVYLGTELPAADLIDLVLTLEADVLALGVTAAPAAPSLEREVDRIARALPRDVELWLEGTAATELASRHPRALALRDYDALEHELLRLGGRF